LAHGFVLPEWLRFGVKSIPAPRVVSDRLNPLAIELADDGVVADVHIQPERNKRCLRGRDVLLSTLGDLL
jgi:hypothetical protein